MVQTRVDRKRIYAEKQQAEVDALVNQGVILCGNAFSTVLFLKGDPGPQDGNGKTLFTGPDGKALQASLRALGYDPAGWCGVASWNTQGESLDPTLLRQTIGALDPQTVIIVDDTAAAVMREAYAEELSALDDFSCAMLQPGAIAYICGMRVMNLGGFEASLNDAHEKQIMWARLKEVPPEVAPY
mgnify:CR=1 FL=1